MNSTIASTCLNFALMNKNIDKIVIGVDSVENLHENLNVSGKLNNNLYSMLKKMKEVDNNIILPMNWKD